MSEKQADGGECMQMQQTQQIHYSVFYIGSSGPCGPSQKLPTKLQLHSFYQ